MTTFMVFHFVFGIEKLCTLFLHSLFSEGPIGITCPGIIEEPKESNRMQKLINYKKALCFSTGSIYHEHT